MAAVNLRTFKKKMLTNKRAFKRFITKLENDPPKALNTICVEVEKTVWPEIDCLGCANCCKKMTPTFTPKDIKRIAAHLEMTEDAFKEKWLYYDKKDEEWMNTKQPCQFLNLEDNKCSIYEVRPADCAGFPHLSKKPAKDYVHIHKQNIEYCPATYTFIEKLKARMENKG
jgi:Fe-S-cluster containining protein